MPDHSAKRRGACGELGRGELYVEGDRACETGDFVALAAIAAHLVDHVSEPLHCELAPLVHDCADSGLAGNAWKRLKERLVAAR